MTAEATADCEERDTWFLDQDVNAWTSLAYAVVGVLIIALAARRRLRIVFVALGLLSVAEGVGSFLYHGSTGDIAHYVHDIALVGALGFVAGWHVGRIAGRPDAAALAGTALTIAVGSVVWAAAPSSTNVMVAVAVAVVAVAEVVGRRRRLPAVWNLPLLALAAGALVVWWAGGPDSPACDAGSWIQPHGLWHTLTALLVLGWVDRASYAADPEHAPRLFGRVPGGLPSVVAPVCTVTAVPDRSTRRHRRSAAGLVVLVAVVASASCSDDDDDDAEDAEESTTTVVTTAAQSGTAPATGAPPGSSVPTGSPALVLGFVTPGPGLLNDLATGQQRGITLAVEDLNAAGGVLGGPVEWVAAAEAASRTMDDVVAELGDAGAGVVVGTVGSDSAPALQQVLSESGGLTCSASATRPSLTEPEGMGSFVRTAIRDDHQAAFVAERIMAPTEGDPPQRVVVVGRDDSYGTELSSALTAELAARGAETVVVSYPARRVELSAEGAQVAAANADAVVAIAIGEAPRLLAAMIDAGVPADRIVGLDGFNVPRIAEQTFPEDPTRLDGLTVIATTGDRAFASRLEAVPASQDQVAYGAQMYDCAITLALAAVSAGSADPAAIGSQIRAVTEGGRTCSNAADCLALLAADEDIDFDGATGGIAIDEHGDVTTARITILRVGDAALQELASEDVDLVALAQQEVYASALFTAQVQQTLRLLGLYAGEVTGVWDQATTDAVIALQRQLGVPETGQWDEATDAAFRARYGDLVSGLSTSITSLQVRLAELGLYDGPIDGRWSAELSESVRALQRQLGVPETGVIDLATLRALYAASAPDPVPTTVATTPPTAPAPTQPTAPPPTQPPPTVPPPPTEPASTEPPPTIPPAGETLLDVLVEDGRFEILLDLLASIDYTELDRTGTYTVFAPTDDAFDLLPEGTVEAIGASPLLAYHVAEGVRSTSQLPPGLELQMIHGATTTIGADGEVVTVNGAPIIEANLPASNGVLHVIEQVLIPPE